MRTPFKALAAAAVLSLALSSVGTAQIRGGFTGNTFAGNDDLSTAELFPLFSMNFFGVTYSSFWLNNNGNITFTGPMSTYTPFPILTTLTPMIAPFFADVDTRVGPEVTYGNQLIGGRNAWGAEWFGVCYYSMHCYETNTFELVLIDRGDVAPGDFDFEFNYGHMGWNTGTASGGDIYGRGGSPARAGWSNGVDNSFEIPGAAIDGAYLDGGLHALRTTSNVGYPGRWAWQVRSGAVTPGGDVVPEPFTIILLGTGLIGIGAARRRRNKDVA